jgi:hypothetical protein
LIMPALSISPPEVAVVASKNPHPFVQSWP